MLGGAPPGPPVGAPLAGPQGMRKFMDAGDDRMSQGPQGPPPMTGSANPIQDPSEEDIDRFNLEIQDFESEMDEEEQDFSEL
jgi:hypothetical protein